MEWIEVTVFTTTQGMDIVGGYLIGQGIGGLVLRDAEDFKAFLAENSPRWDYVEDSLMALATAESAVAFYLPATPQGREQLQAIRQGLPALRERNPGVELGRLTAETVSLNEEDWETAWKQYYHIMHIGKRLVVVPCWESYTPAEGEAVVTLDPGMAFGTGTHETTRLCMTLLEECVTEGVRLLDIGTGSGILAVTGIRLGAGEAVGVDIDPLAVKIAGENADLNQVSDRTRFLCGDLVEQVEGQYQVICANIVADVILRLSGTVGQFLAPGGILLVSGIIEERAEEVKEGLLKAGFRVEQVLADNGWVAMKCLQNN